MHENLNSLELNTFGESVAKSSYVDCKYIEHLHLWALSVPEDTLV